MSESGQHILAGAGELHLEICLNDLANEYCKNIEIVKSKPVVTFKETVTAESIDCLVKSPNRHNRLYMQAMPLSDEFCAEIENGTVSLSMDQKAMTKHIVETYEDWDSISAKKIWCFGPSDTGPNVVVDSTKATDFMNEIQESVVAAFQWASREGGLCDEDMRGIRFNLTEAVLHTDSIHRGGGQIIPAARKAFYASQLSAEPRLVEPIYKVEIQTTEQTLGGVNNVVNRRRGVILNIQRSVGSMYTVTCNLPVLESFGLTDDLRAATQGQAFLQCAFDRWQLINQNPYEVDSNVHKIITDIRKRKGLTPEIPTFHAYIDKL